MTALQSLAASRTAPTHQALCEPSAPPCAPVSGPPAATSGARLPGPHSLQPHWPLPPAHMSRGSCAEPDKTPRKSAPFAGNVGAPEASNPPGGGPSGRGPPHGGVPGGGARGRWCPRAAVSPGWWSRRWCPRRRYPRRLLRPATADPGRGQPRAAPNADTRAPRRPSRRCGPPDMDGLCVNCRNQCGPDWHIFGRSPPD